MHGRYIDILLKQLHVGERNFNSLLLCQEPINGLRSMPYSFSACVSKSLTDDDDFLVRSWEMFSFFTDGCYTLSSLEKDLQSVATTD